MCQTPTVRYRTVMDRAMIALVVACLFVNLVRAGLVALTVPYAAYIDHREDARATERGLPAPPADVHDRVRDAWPFVSWWGGRRIPFREGGDYIGVTSRHGSLRSVGCVIGWIVEHDRKAGVKIDRIVVPEDEVALYGADYGTPMKKADGTRVRTRWPMPSGYIGLFTDTPVTRLDYDPVLLPGEAARLRVSTSSSQRSEAVWTGAAGLARSGTWIVYVDSAEPRGYLLVPLEASPAGGAR